MPNVRGLLKSGTTGQIACCWLAREMEGLGERRAGPRGLKVWNRD